MGKQQTENSQSDFFFHECTAAGDVHLFPLNAIIFPFLIILFDLLLKCKMIFLSFALKVFVLHTFLNIIKKLSLLIFMNTLPL